MQSVSEDDEQREAAEALHDGIRYTQMGRPMPCGRHGEGKPGEQQKQRRRQSALKLQTSNHGPPRYGSASSALDVWPATIRTTARARARSMKMTRWACTARSFTKRSTWKRERTSSRSVRHRVQKHIDTERVAIRRELIEEGCVLAFSLPGIRHVGVVGHDNHDPAVGIANGPEVRIAAVVARSEVCAHAFGARNRYS